MSTQKTIETRTELLIQTISEWPEWKRQSICIDESDFALLESITVHTQRTYLQRSTQTRNVATRNRVAKKTSTY